MEGVYYCAVADDICHSGSLLDFPEAFGEFQMRLRASRVLLGLSIECTAPILTKSIEAFKKKYHFSNEKDVDLSSSIPAKVYFILKYPSRGRFKVRIQTFQMEARFA